MSAYATTAWTYKDVNSERGTEQFVDLGFDKNIFPRPKPLGTIERALTLATHGDDIVLDFFSGSSTTAHAVMTMNAVGGHRKFIMVQLPEPCEEDSDAYKAGFGNICEIGKERIRRAGKKIKDESPLTTQHLDTGFRVLKLDETNMNDVYYSADEYSQGIPDVWDEKTPKTHPHSKPLNLQKALIEATTQKGDWVLDPASGGYSVLTACQELNRNFIGCDIEFGEEPIHSEDNRERATLSVVFSGTLL